MSATPEHIAAMVVCVDYAPLLAQGIDNWLTGVDDLVVVSAARDLATQALCRQKNVRMFLTEIFWDNGAKFNKGAAMAAAYRTLDKRDWVLFFDADITPPANWRSYLTGLAPGNLYGANRFDPDGKRITDPDIAGFFHLAHISDPHMQHDPIVDTHWYHAGAYDTTFQHRWSQAQRIALPLSVTHTGEPGKNWCGVGNEADVVRLHNERRRRRGRWDHEHI